MATQPKDILVKKTKNIISAKDEHGINGDGKKAIALASHSILEMIQTLYFSSRIRHLAFVGAGIYIFTPF